MDGIEDVGLFGLAWRVRSNKAIVDGQGTKTLCESLVLLDGG